MKKFKYKLTGEKPGAKFEQYFYNSDDAMQKYKDLKDTGMTLTLHKL